VAWRTRDGTQFCIDGQVFTVASAVRWLNELGLVDDPRRLDQETSADSAGTLFVPALAGLAAPWWRPAARGVLSGLSLATTRGHIVRAVLEGVAATVAQLVRVVEAEGETSLQVLRVDGGLTHSHVLMQAQADLLQVSVEVYPSGHATPLGAAALARSALERCTPQEALWPWRPTNTFEPQWSRDRADDYLARWQRALEATEDGLS
jgi:glycerol kinase